MLMPKKKLGVAIAIGYKDEVPSLSVKEFETGSEPKFSLTLSPSSLNKVKEAIRTYEKYAKEFHFQTDHQELVNRKANSPIFYDRQYSKRL